MSNPIIYETARTQTGPILWQNVSYGMTVSEVLRAQPSAVKSDELHLLGDGSECLLIISEFELFYKKASVLFYFKDSFLKQVTITIIENYSSVDFNSAVVTLRAKYGRELDLRISESSFSVAEWIAENGVNISLVCFPEIDCFNINFQIRLAQEASKL